MNCNLKCCSDDLCNGGDDGKGGFCIGGNLKSDCLIAIGLKKPLLMFAIPFSGIMKQNVNQK